MRYLFSHQQSLCLCLAAGKVLSVKIRLTLVSEAEEWCKEKLCSTKPFYSSLARFSCELTHPQWIISDHSASTNHLFESLPPALASAIARLLHALQMMRIINYCKVAAHSFQTLSQTQPHFFSQVIHSHRWLWSDTATVSLYKNSSLLIEELTLSCHKPFNISTKV